MRRSLPICSSTASNDPRVSYSDLWLPVFARKHQKLSPCVSQCANQETEPQADLPIPSCFLQMRHIAAYLLLQIGGNASPSAADVGKVLGAVGIEADGERLSTLISELEGKDVAALIAEGSSKLASVRVSRFLSVCRCENIYARIIAGPVRWCCCCLWWWWCGWCCPCRCC